MEIQISAANVAFWERFVPVQESSEDWETYISFPGDEWKDTLGKRMRFLSLAQLVRQVQHLPGSVAECGCHSGHSTYMIARTMASLARPGRLSVFDSFEGLSPRSPEDLQLTPRHVDLFGVQAKLDKGVTMFSCDLATTARNLAAFPFIDFYPGWIPSRFPEVAHERFAFVHIDVDIYQPTKDSLEFFYPRLVEGGVIQIDDYNVMDWPGSKTAVDEFLDVNRPRFFYEIPLGGAFLIK